MSGPPPLRLWLEPGYDRGRFGVWLLDLPGAFGWAASRERAVSQAPSVAGWYRDWTARHGEQLDLVVGPTEIVEEVAASVENDSERNASFMADADPVTAAELETVIRRLGHARADLLAVVDRLEAFEARGGRLLPGDDRALVETPGLTPTRAGAEVLRHVAGSEAWLASRLDPAARFEGLDRGGDIRLALEASRAWAVDTVRAQHRRDPALARVDGKGESWTMRKVLRRLLYHSIDHLRELDGRLARAERRADRLEVREERLVDVGPLARLLRSVGWDRRLIEPGQLERAIAASHRMVGAWDGDELVAFARDVGDGEFTGHVSMVVVDPRWQGQGIAPRLVHALTDDRPRVRFTLGAAGGLRDYYARMGFEPDDSAMVRRRRP